MCADALYLEDEEKKDYAALPSLDYFHRSPAQIRCIVGPVGSGKTTAAAWEICYAIPWYLYNYKHYEKTRWVVVRNTYFELMDTTRKTIEEWFDFGVYRAGTKTYVIHYPDGPQVELMYRSCDRPDDIKKFKSLEITGYWIDESIEVKDEIKNMLKNRIGRFPRKSDVRFGIETTNPPDVTDPTYWRFNWKYVQPGQPGPVIPPGPIPTKEPLPKHEGFWQPPYENKANLRTGYYDDLRRDYGDYPDWVSLYIEGKPGIIVKGKPVYNNFRREYHVAQEPLAWTGGPLFVGWDHSGNTPAAVVVQIPTAGRAQVLREFYSDKMGIVDFGRWVINNINIDFPGAELVHWGDPAGSNEFNTKTGFTSNTKLLRDELDIAVQASEQNFRVRVEAVEQQLGRIDGFLMDPSCIMLTNGFIGGYHYPEHGSLMGVYLPNVRKNKYSHLQDALQYVMVRLFKPIDKKRKDLDANVGEYYDEEANRYDPLGVWD